MLGIEHIQKDRYYSINNDLSPCSLLKESYLRQTRRMCANERLLNKYTLQTNNIFVERKKSMEGSDRYQQHI